MIAEAGRDPRDLRLQKGQAAGAQHAEEQRPEAVEQDPAGALLGQCRLRARARQQPRDRRRGLRAPPDPRTDRGREDPPDRRYDDDHRARATSGSHDRRRGQRRRCARADQHGRLEEVDEPHAAGALLRQQRLEQRAHAAWAVDHDVGVARRSPRALVGANADAHRGAQAPGLRQLIQRAKRVEIGSVIAGVERRVERRRRAAGS